MANLDPRSVPPLDRVILGSSDFVGDNYILRPIIRVLLHQPEQ